MKRVQRSFWQQPEIVAILLDPRIPTREIAHRFGVSQYSAAMARSRARREALLEKVAGGTAPEVSAEARAQDTAPTQHTLKLPTGISTRTIADEISRMLDVAARRIVRNPTPENVHRILGRLKAQLAEEVERALSEADFWAAQVSELEEELESREGPPESSESS